MNKFEDTKLHKLINCKQIKQNNNDYECTKCIENYVLLKEDKKIRCVSINYI